MVNKKYLIGGVLLASTVLLSACGGTSGSAGVVNNTSHPIFKQALVKSSVIFEPSGEIKEKNPTFVWKATGGATAYLLGHEDTEYDSRWTQYTISAADANCVIGNVCSYKPQNIQLEVGDEKAWWVKAKTNSGWQDWSSAHVFKIIADDHSSTSAKTISPAGVVTTATPTFKWTPGNGASEYQFGMENFDSSDWIEYIVPADQANCSSTECSYKPSDLTFAKGDQKTWWVRENISGSWGNWSEGSAFLVDINTPYVPFKSQSNVSNITEVNGKWYGISGKELLYDDGANNVTTIYTAPINYIGGFSKSIPGKLYFRVTVKKPSTVHNSYYGLGGKQSIISLSTLDNTVKVELTGTAVSISSQMKDYLVVASYHRYSGRQPSVTSYYKIDKLFNLISIGTQRGAYQRFSIVSTDQANNTLVVKQRTGGVIKSSKVTDKVGVGLEELTPFKDMPNVKDIVLSSNGLWYAIDSTDTEIFSSDGVNDSVSVYKTDANYKIISRSDKNLTATLNRSRLLFGIEKIENNRIKDASFIFFNTTSKSAKTVYSGASKFLRIKKGMHGYAYITIQHIVYSSNPRAPHPAPNHSKIDRDGKLIYIGNAKKNNYTDFVSFTSIDESKNEIYFTHTVNGHSVNKKITSARNTGLEDL